MGDTAEIIKTVYDIVKAKEDVPIAVEAQKLSMAYAIPRGNMHPFANCLSW